MTLLRAWLDEAAERMRVPNDRLPPQRALPYKAVPRPFRRLLLATGMGLSFVTTSAAVPCDTDRVSQNTFRLLRSAMRLRFADAVLGNCPLGLLILCSGLPLLIGGGAMLLSPVVLSREMTWDFLFNLAGAWHVHLGQAAHVDFHDPLGALNFHLTALGFRLLGPQPAAFLVGTVMVTAAISTAAALVAWRRLPL